MRIFISHSSKDKVTYADSVVEKLIDKVGKDSIVYDALTFEAGEKSIDEIERTLSVTDLFVILLSNTALDSPWVQHELSEAYKRLSDQTLNRIYPLIIDSTLQHSDKRIPDWLKEYNLKYIARPTKAAKLIFERAKDEAWKLHPFSKIKSSIFVGRNDLIDEFETRIDDFEQPPLNTFIVSGHPNIGRKSLIRHCLIKGTKIPIYYDFPSVSLSYQESIEDFILKVSDFGFTESFDLKLLSSSSLQDKIVYALQLVKSISNLSEIILIKDDGCIIDYKGNIANWFRNICSETENYNKIIFAIVTKYKLNFESIRLTPNVSYINVPELSQQERRGLLRRLVEINGLDLTNEELERISRYLTGYPAQVKYAVEIIKENGYPYLIRNEKLLSDYNEQEVSSLLEKHLGNSKVFEILALISQYDAISIEMLYEILSATPDYIECYEELFQESLFELEGINKEYVRLNEVVRNYIARSGVTVSPKHIRKAKLIFEKMFTNSSSAWYNSNDFLLAVKESLRLGQNVDPDYIIPSVYLKSMSDLYSDMQYENVVKLARRALENSANTDSKILYEIRYSLCSALAKLKHKDFLNEVQKLDNDDKKFLIAFYYRQIGKNSYALKFLDELLLKRPDMSKAKREKVLVLKNLQEFEKATALAKENYYQYSDNPYHIHAYFDCLINTYFSHHDDILLLDLIGKLNRIQSEKARSMYGRCNALYLAFVDFDYESAIAEIDKVIQEFPKDRKYARSVKFDIARLFKDLDVMQQVIIELEADDSNTNTVVICKSKFLASKGDVMEATNYFTNNIRFFTDESKKAFCQKLATAPKTYSYLS